MGNHDHHGELDHEEGSVQDEDELDDEFDDYATVTNRGMITTVPAKEPVYNAVPLKSALKKPKGASNGSTASVKLPSSSSSKSNSDPPTSSSRKPLMPRLR